MTLGRGNLATVFITLVLMGLGLAPEVWIPSQAASKTKADHEMPTLNGDAAIEFLKKEAIYGSLTSAIASIDDDNLPNEPNAQIKPGTRTSRARMSLISDRAHAFSTPHTRTGSGAPLRSQCRRYSLAESA